MQSPLRVFETAILYPPRELSAGDIKLFEIGFRSYLKTDICPK